MSKIIGVLKALIYVCTLVGPIKDFFAGSKEAKKDAVDKWIEEQKTAAKNAYKNFDGE